MSQKSIDQPRPLKVIYIGAGVSGITAAIEFLKQIPSLELVIYEKNSDIGGTWFENRYPGCACDVPSHSYQLSFESSVEWSKFYADAPEILQYWKRVAAKYNVFKHIRLNHKCMEARWDEQKSKWKVRLEQTDISQESIVEDEADVLITGTGTLNEWKWPAIEGLHNFKGKLLHTASWDDSWQPKDKTVAIIGAGSSGIQVVPALVPTVKAMHHYVRSRTWISPQLSEDVLKSRTTQTGEHNFEYTQDEIERWKRDPREYACYRTELELRLQSFWELSQKNNDRHHAARIQYEANMRQRLQTRPDLLNRLLPTYPPLCKRLTPGPGYLEALCADNVSVISDQILKIDEKAVITVSGARREVDAIICATGFETRQGFGFPIYGRDGLNLRSKYSQRPKSYLGLCTDNFPNFFQSLGPNAFQGAGSLLIQIEYTHRYMAQILAKLAYGNVRTIEPKRRAVNAFTDFCDEYFKQTVYLSDCASWYKADGRVSVLWPGSSTHAIRALTDVRWEDFEIENCDGHDFGWFGDGTTLADRHMDESNIEALTWYLKDTKYLHDPLDRKSENGSDMAADNPHNKKVNGNSECDRYDLASDSNPELQELHGGTVGGSPVPVLEHNDTSQPPPVFPHGIADTSSAIDQRLDATKLSEEKVIVSENGDSSVRVSSVSQGLTPPVTVLPAELSKNLSGSHQEDIPVYL